MTDYTDFDDQVAEATSAEKFDALDFFSNASLPAGTVTLYRDTASAVRLNELKEQKAANDLREEEEGIGLDDDYDYIDEDEVADLTRKLKNSAVTFKLQALAPAARTALEKASRAKNKYVEGGENTEYWEAFNANLVAKSITGVSDALGRADENEWDAARVTKFAEIVETSEWQKVFAKVYELNFVSDAIDRAVGADF